MASSTTALPVTPLASPVVTVADVAALASDRALLNAAPLVELIGCSIASCDWICWIREVTSVTLMRRHPRLPLPALA